MPIKAIALNGFTASCTACMFEPCYGLLLRRGRTRHVEDFFLDDGAVQVVHTVTEGDLRQRQPHTHPISGEVVDVIEINATDRQIAELLKRGRGFYVREDSCLRFKSKRNEASKPASFSL